MSNAGKYRRFSPSLRSSVPETARSDAVGEPPAARDPRHRRPERPGIHVDRDAVERRAAARDHVDDGEERARPVERRGRPADDFDAIEHRHVDAEVGADRRLIVHIVVDAVAVDEQQDARVVVAGARESADADVAVVAVVRDVEPADRAQDVGERPVPVSERSRRAVTIVTDEGASVTGCRRSDAPNTRCTSMRIRSSMPTGEIQRALRDGGRCVQQQEYDQVATSHGRFSDTGTGKKPGNMRTRRVCPVGEQADGHRVQLVGYGIWRVGDA